MGITLCKKNEYRKAHDTNSSSSSQWNSDSSIDSYESALQSDRSLCSFDTFIHYCTTSAINSVANSPSPSPSPSSLSLDSLCHVTSSLADINKHVVECILQSKKDIWQNPELLDLVKEYFEYSSKTLSFYSALKNCLMKTKNSHIFIQLAIEWFKEEKSKLGENKLFRKTLQELNNFKSTGDPFGGDFFPILLSIYDSQASLLLKPHAKRENLDKKLGKSKWYRKVWNVLFGAAFALVVICSLVAAAVAEPPVAAALLVANSALSAANSPLKEVGKWMNSVLQGYENGVENERDLVLDMQRATFMAVAELQTIKGLVEHLRVEIEAMLFRAGIPVKQDDELALTLVINEIGKNLRGFFAAVDDLETNSDRYRKDIARARSVILNRIIKFPTIG